MVSALQSLPVAAVTSARVVGRLDVTVADRFAVIGSRSGRTRHGLSAIRSGAEKCSRRHANTVAGSKLESRGYVGRNVVVLVRKDT